jgi:hypothetical protein
MLFRRRWLRPARHPCHREQTHDRTRSSRTVTICHATAAARSFSSPFREKVPREQKVPRKQKFLRGTTLLFFNYFRTTPLMPSALAGDDEDGAYGLKQSSVKAIVLALSRYRHLLQPSSQFVPCSAWHLCTHAPSIRHPRTGIGLKFL